MSEVIVVRVALPVAPELCLRKALDCFLKLWKCEYLVTLAPDIERIRKSHSHFNVERGSHAELAASNQWLLIRIPLDSVSDCTIDLRAHGPESIAGDHALLPVVLNRHPLFIVYITSLLPIRCDYALQSEANHPDMPRMDQTARAYVDSRLPLQVDIRHEGPQRCSKDAAEVSPANAANNLGTRGRAQLL